jgi:CheY-like chemotaxis protein
MLPCIVPPEDAEVAGLPTRILVVDDTDPVREMTARILQDAGYELVEAIDGSAALELLEVTR